MTTAPGAPDAPIADFSQCHAGIVQELDRLGELARLLEPAARARAYADKAVAFFREAIFEHHLDEERELFPLVLQHAAAGAEKTQVQTMVKRLTHEHRQVEALWKHLEPGLKKVAKGHVADVNPAEVERLVAQYRAHAQYEEQEFLPLSQAILGRNANHLAALGLALHLRHQRPDDLPAYV